MRLSVQVEKIPLQPMGEREAGSVGASASVSDSAGRWPEMSSPSELRARSVSEECRNWYFNWDQNN